MGVGIDASGPLFDGRAARIIEAACQDGQDGVADHAVNLIHDRLGQVLRHPTGYYESQIVTDKSREQDVVNDGGVVYGPWLEGVGSRNKSTRFPGYGTFRLVAQEIERDAGRVAEEAMAPRLRELG
jgi:hypothetical protein